MGRRWARCARNSRTGPSDCTAQCTRHLGGEGASDQIRLITWVTVPETVTGVALLHVTVPCTAALPFTVLAVPAVATAGRVRTTHRWL
jgi:hypothetical protein